MWWKLWALGLYSIGWRGKLRGKVAPETTNKLDSGAISQKTRNERAEILSAFVWSFVGALVYILGV